MGYALSSVFNHATTAVAFAPIVNMPLTLLGGYMINLNDIFSHSPQRYIAWFMYLSPVRYGFTSLTITQFPYPSPLSDPARVEQDAAVKNYGFNNVNYWGCVGMLFLLFIFFRTLVVVSLSCQDKKRGGSSNDTRNQNIQARKPLANK